MRDDRESAQRGRMKFLEHHLVGDDVLDVVGHHRGGGAEDIDPKIAVGERGESAMLAVRARARQRVSGFNGLGSLDGGVTADCSGIQRMAPPQAVESGGIEIAELTIRRIEACMRVWLLGLAVLGGRARRSPTKACGPSTISRRRR